MTSEREMERLVLQEMGIDLNKKTSYKEIDIIEHGNAENYPTIKKILEKCGGKPESLMEKKPVSKSGSYGKPECIIKLKKQKVILIIECKKDKEDHQSSYFSKPAKYNVDGVLYYSKYFKENFTVLFLAVSGKNKKD